MRPFSVSVLSEPVWAAFTPVSTRRIPGCPGEAGYGFATTLASRLRVPHGGSLDGFKAICAVIPTNGSQSSSWQMRTRATETNRQLVRDRAPYLLREMWRATRRTTTTLPPKPSGHLPRSLRLWLEHLTSRARARFFAQIEGQKGSVIPPTNRLAWKTFTPISSSSEAGGELLGMFQHNGN
jgi:hypothetical protein